ncbi:MAG: transporter substrate-binding domain-containing protein [Deltaproteobacteria bacterium]|nr:transporter substrate-binding domain-containing protein [Deltaproteobacteria bacterium]
MKAFKILIRMCLILCLLSLNGFLQSGCSRTIKEPLTFDNLEGKRVGVMCGYSSDYILSTGAYNLKIYRYSFYADMQLALRFNRLDAAAMENDEAYIFCRIEPRFKIGLVVASRIEFAYPFNAEKLEILQQFNSFIKEFRKTPEYEDIIQRVEASAVAPYLPKKVVNQVNTDRVLKVAAFDGWEPVSYINTSTGEWEGSDVELVTHFANSLGARVKIIDMSYNQMLIELGAGMVDLNLCPSTLMYKKDMEMSHNITISDGVFLKDIVLIVNQEGT